MSSNSCGINGFVLFGSFLTGQSNTVLLLFLIENMFFLYMYIREFYTTKYTEDLMDST